MLNLLIPAYLINELTASFVDNVIRDTVAEPALGSVVYCDLAIGTMEHSGIYVGNGQIMHYNKHGIVERVSREEFITGTSAISIYVGCVGNRPVGSPDIVSNAERIERSQQNGDYNLILNNCHQFSETCVTGKPSTATFLRFLKWTCESRMGVDNWRVWSRDAYANARTVDLTPSQANLEHLAVAIEKQKAVVYESDRLVLSKVSEFSRHSSNQPSTIFFWESRIESWQRKYDALDAEVSSRQRIADHEEARLQDLYRAYDAMKAQLEEQDAVADISAQVAKLSAILESLKEPNP